jgi:predicted dehydrogenase
MHASVHAPGARLRVGVIGGGLIAQAIHLPALRTLDEQFELVALADPSRRVRDGLAARFGIPRVHADHRSLLEAGVDAAVVCAPTGLHAAIVLDALDAGAHVLVEKPLCIARADVRRIAARAGAAGLVVQVGYMKRFTSAYEALRADLHAAEPELRLVHTLTVDPRLARDFSPPGFIAANDVASRLADELAATTALQVAEEIGSDRPEDAHAFTDAFLGALVHDVNLVLGALPEPPGAALDAFATADGRVAGGTIELPGGGRWNMAWLLLDGAGPFSEDVRFLADDGEWRLRFPAPYLRQAPVVYTREHRAGDSWARAAESSYGDPYLRELEHFHACVSGGEPCRTPPEQAERDLELLAGLFCARRIEAAA